MKGEVPTKAGVWERICNSEPYFFSVDSKAFRDLVLEQFCTLWLGFVHTPNTIGKNDADRTPTPRLGEESSAGAQAPLGVGHGCPCWSTCGQNFTRSHLGSGMATATVWHGHPCTPTPPRGNSTRAKFASFLADMCCASWMSVLYVIGECTSGRLCIVGASVAGFSTLSAGCCREDLLLHHGVMGILFQPDSVVSSRVRDGTGANQQWNHAGLTLLYWTGGELSRSHSH